MARTLIRIDKNGTKYYADDTCRRCGGAGERSEWYYTGCICFECGGTGRSKMRTEKVYTPEYAAKLEAQRMERTAKKMGYASAADMQAAQAEREARIEAERKAEEARIEAERKAEEARKEAEKAISQYVGEVGGKVDLQVTYIGSPHFERKSFGGYGTETCYIHTFKDASGNKLVWKTGKYAQIEEGATVHLAGTIKEHSEYKGEKQTSLIRCKIA